MNVALHPMDGLTRAARGEMRVLLDHHFEGVDVAQFERDLEDKHWALLIRDAEGRLAGFTTIAVVHAEADGEPLVAIYSGDTIVDPSCWGSSALARGWIAAVRQLGAAHPGLPLVWLLICSGYRTYRFLPVFFREFYPRFDRPTPPAARRLMDRLARARYGDGYEPRRGIVTLARPQRLRAHLRAVPLARYDAPIDFFVRANPGHPAGDELVCMAALDDGNLTRAGRRMVRAGPAGAPAPGAPVSRAAAPVLAS